MGNSGPAEKWSKVDSAELAIATRKAQKTWDIWGFVPSEAEMEHLWTLREIGHGEALVKVRAGQPYRLEMIKQNIDYDTAIRQRKQGLTNSP